MSSYQFLGCQIITHNPRHFPTVTKTDPEEIKRTEEAIASLPKILGNDGWLLTGGLSIPTTIGTFTRYHKDIDIGVDRRDLPKVAERALEHDYGLFSRVFMGATSSKEKVDIYTAITLEQLKEEPYKIPKNFRFVRVDSRGRVVRHERLLDYFDVYAHKTNGDLICLDSGLVFPEEQNIGTSYKTIQGDTIIVRDLRFIRKIKERKNTSVNIYDTEIINTYLEAKA